MKTLYVIAGLLAFVYWRDHHGSGVSRTQEAEEAHGNGTDFLPDLWGTLHGKGTQSPNYSNALPGSATADPGGHAAANLRLNPFWDGGM